MPREEQLSSVLSEFARTMVTDFPIQGILSSKRCSRCGSVKAKLGLNEREYHCEACGLVMDRDLDAATNLAGWPSESTPRGQAPWLDVEGRSDRVVRTSTGRHTPQKRQPKHRPGRCLGETSVHNPVVTDGYLPYAFTNGVCRRG